jgi:hypothetical protein
LRLLEGVLALQRELVDSHGFTSNKRIC